MFRMQKIRCLYVGLEFFRAEKHDEVQWKKEMVEMWTKPRLK